VLIAIELKQTQSGLTKEELFKEKGSNLAQERFGPEVFSVAF